MFKLRAGTPCFLAFCFLFCQHLHAHNGKVGYAYPLQKITVDGNLSDWPKGLVRYMLNTELSPLKSSGEADYNGFFQVGYNLAEHSLYLAFTITDDNFLEDTTANVKWDSQDGLELYLDARHLPTASGVSSFMYSQKLRNINKSYYDHFSKNASWDMMEVVMTRNGSTRIYEWKINMGEELTVSKSVGLDFYCFDRDPDGTFSYAGWGRGEAKYVNPKSLGDIILLPANNKNLASIYGNVEWNQKMSVPLPGAIIIRNIKTPQLWMNAEVDSLGHYFAEVPQGNYEIYFPDAYFINGKELYSTTQEKHQKFSVRSGEKFAVPKMTVNAELAPDLIPAKGVMFDFNTSTEKEVDNFIETYQRYFNIPGVSLALIKDGKLVYHKTYGVKNTFTGEMVDSNTLFEAASVTKPVFAFAVQRLAERGVIDLDKPLYQYLPYPDIEYDERYKLITARHVLTHRTRFPNWRSMNPDGKLDLKFAPGTKYNYSGEGFEYLKMVIQTITDKSVEQVLKEEVIEPIGLYHTFFSRNDSLRAMVANGHMNMLPNYDDLPEYPGMAYSMHTEAKIFTKFMIYLLEQKGLKATTYDTMFSKHSEYPLEPGDEKPDVPTYMGESLEIRETPFGKSFGHGGNNGDFKCRFEVYKDLRMGYVIFTNSNTSDPLLHYLHDFLVEGKKASP